jgi:hypothetical protein
MTAQNRYGRATIEAAHAIEKEPPPDPITLDDVIGGVGLFVAICLAFYYGPGILTIVAEILRGWVGVR